MVFIIKNGHVSDDWFLHGAQHNVRIKPGDEDDIEAQVGPAAIESNKQLWADLANPAKSLTANDGTRDLTVLEALLLVRNWRQDTALSKTDQVKSIVQDNALDLLVIDIQVAGLVVTVDIGTLVVNDVTTVVADPVDEKFLLLRYVFDTVADTLAVKAYEKTKGTYADLTKDELLVNRLGEWSTPALGTVLTEVT